MVHFPPTPTLTPTPPPNPSPPHTHMHTHKYTQCYLNCFIVHPPPSPHTHTHTHTHTNHLYPLYTHTLAHADPYVKVRLLHSGKKREKWKTSIKKNTLAPVFHEQFQFNISNMQITDISLQLVLMDFDRFIRNERMGTIQIGDHSPQKSGQAHWKDTCLSPHQTISRWHSIIPVGHSVELSDIDHP